MEAYRADLAFDGEQMLAGGALVLVSHRFPPGSTWPGYPAG